MLCCFQTSSAPSPRGRAAVRALALCCALGPGAAGVASALVSSWSVMESMKAAPGFALPRLCSVYQQLLLFLFPDLGSVIRQVLIV